MAIALVTYCLWGGAAAIYKGHLDEQLAALATEVPEAGGEFESGGVTPRFPLRRSRGLGAAVAILVAGVCTFVANSIVQLSHLPSLIPYMFQERGGYLTFCVGVLAVTGLGLFGVGRVQQSLETENPFSKGHKRKKLSKIRTPKPLDD